MVPQYKNILIQILTISKYPGDKEQYAKEFEERNFDDALFNILERLPKDQQEQVKACQGDPYKLQQFFTSQEYAGELKYVYLTALIDFVKSLAPTLDDQQKEQIIALFSQQPTIAHEVFNSLSLQA